MAMDFTSGLEIMCWGKTYFQVMYLVLDFDIREAYCGYRFFQVAQWWTRVMDLVQAMIVDIDLAFLLVLVVWDSFIVSLADGS